MPTVAGSWVLATGNPGKLSEFRALLSSLPIEIVAAGDLGYTSPAETGETFAANALLKAREAARITGLPAIADDSGLVVEALDGAPGLFSARYAGPDASDRDNVALLLKRLGSTGDPHRRAHFVACIVAVTPTDPDDPIIVEGRWHGTIADTPRGEHGFGYDPIFVDADSGLTAAQLDPAEKNRRSHRAQAIRLLTARLSASIRVRGNH